ncbi:MAG: hypothetical protein Q8N14_01320 [Candidatus Omnitrophota bacterium]|nr:hypothetical protein [Candidatus Omnitrophota bacterium]
MRLGQKNIINSNGQSLVEYSVVIIFVVCAIFMMSRYVIRSAAAGIKTWEGQVNTSLHEPFKYLVPTLTYVTLRFHVWQGGSSVGWYDVSVPDASQYCISPDFNKLSLGGWYQWTGRKVVINNATKFLRCASGGILPPPADWASGALYKFDIYPPDSPNRPWPAINLTYFRSSDSRTCEQFWRGGSKKTDVCEGNTFTIQSF